MEDHTPRGSARPFPAEGVELVPGRDYRIVERINRPAEGADRGEGAESVVFKIERGGKQFALKMINHSIGTVEDIVASLASERHSRGEPWRQLRGDRAAAEERRARRNTDEALLEELGGEWQRISRLMLEYPHQNLAPVLHWYHSGEPSLRGRDAHGFFVPDEARREAAADRTLFMVMTLYPHGSLSTFMKRHGIGDAARAGADFYGLGWTRFNTFMRHMLQAVSHLIDNHMVHGDVKLDQFFMDRRQGEDLLVLGDFGCAWDTRTRTGGRLENRRALVDIRAGVGNYKAPEVRGRRYADRAKTIDTEANPLLSDLYGKAESFTVGVLLYEMLSAQAEAANVFDRLADTHFEKELAHESSRGGRMVPGPGRRQPGWEYSPEEVPALPDSLPDILREPIIGLVQCWVDERWSAADALRHISEATLELDARRAEAQRQAHLAEELSRKLRADMEAMQRKQQQEAAQAQRAMDEQRAATEEERRQQNARMEQIRHDQEAERIRAAEQLAAAQQAQLQAEQRQRRIEQEAREKTARMQREAEAVREREAAEQSRRYEQLQRGTEQDKAQIGELRDQMEASRLQHEQQQQQLARDKQVAEDRLRRLTLKAEREAVKQAREKQEEIDRTRAEAAAKDRELQELRQQGQLSQSRLQERAREKQQADQRIAELEQQYKSADTERQKIKQEQARLEEQQARDQADRVRFQEQQRKRRELEDRLQEDYKVLAIESSRKQQALEKRIEDLNAQLADAKKLSPRPETEPQSAGSLDLVRTASNRALYALLTRAGIDSTSASGYCDTLSDQGFGTEFAFSTLSAARLRLEPYCFKQGHIELLQTQGDGKAQLMQLMKNAKIVEHFDAILKFVGEDKPPLRKELEWIHATCMDEPKLSSLLSSIPRNAHRVKMKKALLDSRPKPPPLGSAPAAEEAKPAASESAPGKLCVWPEPEPEPEPHAHLEPQPEPVPEHGTPGAVTDSLARASGMGGAEAELRAALEHCCRGFLRENCTSLDYICYASEQSTVVLCETLAARLGQDTSQVQQAISALRATIDQSGALTGSPVQFSQAAHQPAERCPLLSPMQIIRQQGEDAVIGRAHGGRRVFRAQLITEQTGSHDVAIKLFPVGASDLLRSANVAKLRQVCDSVSHCSGVVRCIGVVDAIDHCAGVVSPLYAGSLKDYLVSLGNVGLPPKTAMHFSLQIAETLESVHAVIDPHSGKAMKLDNLKPSNCLLGPGDRIHLADVGISSVVDDASAAWGAQESREAAYYKAPESFSPEEYGDPSAEEKVDIWAWGCVLLESVVGCHPWARTATGKKSKPRDIMKLIMNGEVPQAPQGAEAPVIMCFHLAAFAFEHRVAERPTAAQLVPRVAELLKMLLE